jgi:hypothetical protein
LAVSFDMNPNIEDIISKIIADHEALGITLYHEASDAQIEAFEKEMKVILPEDVKTFYKFCNGFESDEDMFRIIPLEEIIQNAKAPDSYLVRLWDFHFAEYMIFCDMWTLSIEYHGNSYAIYNKTDNVIVLTNSFAEFLQRFLIGGVFDGLYHWRKELEQLTGGQSDLSNNAAGAGE